MKVSFNGSTGVINSTKEFFRVLKLEISSVLRNEVLIYRYKPSRFEGYTPSDNIEDQIYGTGHILMFEKILKWQRKRAIRKEAK